MTFDGSANRGDPSVIRSELDERTNGRSDGRMDKQDDLIPGSEHVWTGGRKR